MRTSRKKLLRLDEKAHYYNELYADEQESNYRSYEHRKPRHKQSADEVFPCKH